MKKYIAIATLALFFSALNIPSVAAACTITPDTHWMNSGVRDGWIAYADEHMIWNYGICYGYYPMDSLHWDTNGEVLDLYYTGHNFNGGSISTDWDTYSNLYIDETVVVTGRDNQFFVELYGTNSGSSYVIDDFWWYDYDPYLDIYRWYKQELDRTYFIVS
jgi:hypothetical protein